MCNNPITGSCVTTDAARFISCLLCHFYDDRDILLRIVRVLRRIAFTLDNERKSEGHLSSAYIPVFLTTRLAREIVVPRWPADEKPSVLASICVFSRRLGEFARVDTRENEILLEQSQLFVKQRARLLINRVLLCRLFVVHVFASSDSADSSRSVTAEVLNFD